MVPLFTQQARSVRSLRRGAVGLAMCAAVVGVGVASAASAPAADGKGSVPLMVKWKAPSPAGGSGGAVLREAVA